MLSQRENISGERELRTSCAEFLRFSRKATAKLSPDFPVRVQNRGAGQAGTTIPDGPVGFGVAVDAAAHKLWTDEGQDGTRAPNPICLGAGEEGRVDDAALPP